LKISVHHLDIREMIVPITLLKVTQAFRKIKPGEFLEILGSDSDTRKDLFHVLNSFHYKLIDFEKKNSFYRIRIKKER